MKKQGEPRFSLVCRAVVYQLCALLALQPAHPAFAEGIAVATGNTTLNQAGNGVPIVDIATPNGAGLSHNLYQDFNVGQAGVILNNATGQLTQTQLGGLIQNNPHLNGQAANLIINEVVGANPSQLQGYLEVAGPQAGVVVANPNGLTCDGCGFINTPNVTLSTGKPVLDAQGQLQALDVKQGTLTVGGKGLDATRQASVDLVARAVQLNGALHGQTVNVVAGANKVDRQTGDIVAQAGNGPAPEVAIDTAALGGMYAGKIRLVSTEQGVGVNLANVVAKQGDLTLDANGRVRLRDSSSAGNLQVSSQGDLAVTGAIHSGGAVKLAAGSELTAQDADIAAKGDATLKARAQQLQRTRVSSGGTLALQANDALVVREGELQGETLHATAQQLDTQSALTAKDVTLQAEQLRQAGQVQGSSVKLAAGVLRHEGTTRAAQNLTIDATTLDNQGTLESGQAMSVVLGERGYNAGELRAGNNLAIQAGTRWEQGEQGKSHAGQRIQLQAQQVGLGGDLGAPTLDINANELTVAGKVKGNTVQLQAGVLTNRGEVQAGQTLNWQGSRLANSGTLQGDKLLVLKGDALQNQGTLAGGDSLTLQADTLDNEGRIASQLATLAGRQLRSSGTLLGVSRLSLTGDELALTGQQLTDGELELGSRLLQLSGQSLVGGKAGVTAERGNFDGVLKAQSLVLAVKEATSEGKLHSREGIAWEGQRLATGSASELLANHDVSLNGDQLALGGTVGAGQNTVIRGKQVTQHGQLASGQLMKVNADELALAGLVQGDSINLTSERAIQQGRILATDTLNWHSKQMDGNGLLQAGQALNLSGERLTHSGTAVTAGKLALTFAELNSTGGLFANQVAVTGSRLLLKGALESKSSAKITADELHLGGELRTGADLALGATLLTLSGSQYVGGNLQLQAEQADVNGELEVGKKLKLDAKMLASRGKLLASQADIAAVNWQQRGELTTDNELVWRGDKLTQEADGSLRAGGVLNLSGDGITLAGDVAAKGDVAVVANAYQQQGAMNAAQGLRIDATKLQLDGTTQAKAAQLHSQVGGSRGQHLIGQQLNWQSDTLANQGWLQAGEGLALTGRTLDNEGTVIAGGNHQLNATERLNNQGNLAGKTLSLTTKALQNGGLLQGKQGITLQAEEATLTGRLVSQGEVQLGAKLLALGGNANIGGALTLQGDIQQLTGAWRVGGLLQSTGKQLTLAGDWQAGQWQLQADGLTNKGRLASEQAANFKVTEWHNEQGASLIAAGSLNLTGQRLLQQGIWLGNGSQTLMVDEITQQGQWLGDGVLQVKGSKLVNSGTLRAAGLDLTVNEIENRSRMESGGEFNWQGGQWRNLGALLASHATLTGDTLLNSGDVGTRQLTMKAATRLDNRGVLVGKEGINLTAATLDSQGDMLSNGPMQLGASLLTLNGLTQADGELVVTAEQAALAGNLAADQLQWRGKTLVMSGTAAARDVTLSGEQVTLDGTLKGDHQQVTATTLTTGQQSQLLAKTGQQLTAGQMTLQGSAVAGGAQRIEATRLSQQGVLASGGSLSLQVADTLRNDGKVSAQAITLTAAHIDNGGALVSKDALNLKTGTLTNRGHWQSDQGITLTANRLLNSGQWVSGLGQTLTLDALDNSGTFLADADLTINAPQLSSSGKLLANKDLVLNTNEATLGSGSTTASNGQLQLHAGTLTSQGTLSSAGVLSWQGANLVHSGSAVTNGALTLQGESVTLDGDLQGERVLLDTGTLTSRGKLTSRGDLAVNARGAVQHHGQLQGNQVVLRSASWQGSGGVGSGGALELRTGQLQLAGPWRIRGEADIQADTMTLGGSLVSGGNLTLTSRGALTSQAGSQLVSGGALSLDGTTLTQQGLWQSARGMSLKGSRFEQQGDLLAGGDLLLRSGYWQQGGKTRANGGLNAELTEGATFAGTVQADGNATLSAPALTLKGTLAAKGNVALSANTLISQLGNLLSGSELAMNAARIEQQGRVETTRLQSGGALQNDGVMLVTGQGSISGARLDNRGTLQGDGLTISSRQLDNRGALLGNTLTLTHDTLVNRGRVQGGTLNLTTRQLDNGQGAVLRGQHVGDITATTLTNAGELSSAGQLLLKGNQLDNSGLISANLLEASPLARLANSGTLFGQQLILRSGELYAPGKILAGQKATLDTGRVTGIGEWLSGGDLALKTVSSLTSQGTLSAKGALDLQVQGDWQHQGQWGAGQRFNAGVTGQLNNRGALVSNGVMQLGAQRLENSGSVQSGQGLTLNTQGELRNTGMLASQGDLGWQGESLFNGGTVYSGGSQALTANSNLTNEYGTLLAERGTTIKVNNGQLVNASGTIDGGDRSLYIQAASVINKKAKFEVSNQSKKYDGLKFPTRLLLSHQPEGSEFITFTEEKGPGYYVTHQSNYEVDRVSFEAGRSEFSIVTDSPEAKLTSLGDIIISSADVSNISSIIASGHNIDISTSSLSNRGNQLGSVVEFVDYIHVDTLDCLNTYSNCTISSPDERLWLVFELSGTRLETKNYSTSNAIISAGGNITGTVAGMIDNVTIKAHAGAVSSTTQRPSVSLPQAQGTGAAPGLQGDAQYLAQQLKLVGPDNGVPLPDFQLPNGDKGLFTINGNSDSPYLIEVNPLLANLGQAGNGMMDRIDAALQQQLQGAGPLSFEAVSGSGGVAQVTDHGTDWTLPGRTSGGFSAPDLQLPSGMTPSNSGHVTTAGQWQQSLQPGWQAPVVSAVAVTAPGPVQTGLQAVPALATQPQIETSPTLTQVDKFLGSSYFFGQVNFAPEKDIKLLGDAAFDTRVIRDAVLAQTGRRFINGEIGSDLAQMRWLIDNAAQNRRDLGLTPGVTLSAAQVAQLGRSMVWWEPVWFNGQIVLAPKLYLTEADKRHLSGSVITAANIDLTAGGINNSGTLLADGTLSLKSGTTLVNQGQIQAGGRLELLAKGDILNQSLIKGGEVAIASLDGSVRNETRTAQRHVDVNGILSDVLSDQTRFSRTDIGDIARIESAGNLLLQAGQDISLSASNLLAGLDMTLNAGWDITIGSLEDRRKWEEGNSRFSRVEQLMSSLDAGRALRLSADRDLTISASSLTAKGDASLTAGNELMLKTANNEASQYTTRRNGYDSARQREEVGVNLNADNIALGAGSDIAMRAVNVQAEGELAVTAGRDLLLEAGDAMDYRESYTRESKKKAFSKKTTTTHDISEQHMAQATELGGQYVLLKAQQDLAVKGSNVVGDLGATLLAGRDLNIDTVDLLNRELHFRETKRSGLMGSGGIGFTIGKQQQSSDMVGTTLIREGSTVGSVQGDVTLQAGNRLQVSGSDIIAGKDLLLVGKDVTISSAEQQVTRKEEFKSKSGGLTVALTGGAVTAVQSAYDTIKASKESSNDRLVALQGTKAAMNGYQAWQGMEAMADAGGVPDPSFVGIAISVGSQRSQSNNQSSETNALTSELNAGGDATVLARGDAANSAGDLVMIGSSIKGHNVTLGAARDLVLQSAVNSSDTRGSNSSSGWNAGISFGFTQGSAGISIFANMNAAKGKENGDSDRYTETSITASDTLTLKSGRDATLLGAQVSGDKVTADIGRNLTLTSQQDNDHYQSKQSSIAAGGSFTIGSMTGSGYINASRQKIRSDFESVVEQTGIFAGKQGFAIQVGEHTQLNGAVLAGSADESKNRLSTGTLGWSDLVNRADYKVESQSIGISGSGGSKGGFSGQGAPTAASVLGGSNSSGSASSTTFAAISGGAIEIRNGAAQQQDVLTLLRDPAQAANGLSPIFDKQKELERMQEAQLIGEVGQQATQMVVSHHLDKANQKAKDDPEYANSKEYKALQEKWGIGSNFQRGMQAATAALQGLAGGDLTQAAAGAASPYLAQMVKQQTDDGPSRVMAHALVQGALAATQNKNAMVGATGAATGELVGMMATQLYHKDASQLTEGEKETVSTLATLAAGLAGGLTGDNTAGALAGAQTGKTVVENNSLAGDKARESLKGSNEWWKQRVRDTLGENTSSQITNGVLNALAEVGDTGLLAADSAFDVAAALVTCSLGEAYCNQAKSDLGKKNQAASDAMNAVMSGDAWAAVKGTVGKAAQGDQVALENLAGVLAGALVPAKGTGLIKGGDPVVTVVSKETGSKLLTAGEKGAGQVLREVEVRSGGKGSWTKELNKPEPNTIYKVDGNKVYQTDSLGRVEKVESSLSLTKNDRNTYQQCVTGKCGISGDEGGHLIASVFNGPGERLNLLPMNANLNKGAWKKMENAWASALKEGKSVSVKIEPIYNGSSVRPDRFTVRYSIGGDRPAIIDFKNSPGGI
ncbi:filamentous hemagglutinin N-terminal domain-containing protein [Aeromonas veronii]|uniref:two-partner secretion domain-containing protein n=1 Tax=Aeromonas veronii TaxID=654 RepID=UPI001C5B2B51|nr:hemagglutinin repeat-containing protein [Aeromonas veronii]MBW3775644.1 filamentous hemagglutinin N-terminal domain-containing protein [Aeromonas veronii]